MDYAYTYPHDTSFIDRNTEPGRIRDAAHEIFHLAGEFGIDIWDLTEDAGKLTDDEKDGVHRALGATEPIEEIHRRRALGHRYSR